MAIALDTLDYARRLREAGFTEQQAEGQARALAAAMTDALATKQDLRELETRLGASFAQLEARTDAHFAQVDARFARLEASTEARFAQVDTRLIELEKRVEVRFNEQNARLSEQAARFEGLLAGLEHRMTLRLGGMLIAALGAFSALVKLL